ncbi:MAG: apolipoprotein N-acyltransferase [Candidatus Omnitrophica bacterium]|nr:apolipoprotein N-acyltransferase [Candidatus Omnitrophota bacterium]
MLRQIRHHRSRACRPLRRDILLCLLSAGLLCLSFSPINAGFAAWVALVPWLSAIAERSGKQRAALSLLCGFPFFLITLSWVGHVTVIGLLILCAYLSVYFICFGAAASLLSKPCARTLLLLAGFWTALEYFRSTYIWGGFGWALLGYSQYRNLSLIQCADIVGVWGVSFLIVFFNLTLYAVWRALERKQPFSHMFSSVALPLLISTILLADAYTYGQSRLGRAFPCPEVTISVVQPNIAQEEKWSGWAADRIVQRHIFLSRQAARENPDLIIWPETAVPGYLLDDARFFNAVSGAAESLHTNLLVGSARESAGKMPQTYNSAFLINRNGRVVDFYDKIHLVPFGEYIPGRPFLNFLEQFGIADFTPGTTFTIFPVQTSAGGTVRIGVLICFEDIFPRLVQKFRKEGAEILVTITNEAWFQRSDEPQQHLAISVFRAIENRCWFIRCANTGISGFIDSHGRIRGKVEQNGETLFVDGWKTMRLTDNFLSAPHNF